VAALPVGFSVVADSRLSTSRETTVLHGGSPWHLVRLTAAGAGIARRLLDGAAVSGAADGALAARLVRAGLAHPQPAPADVGLEIVVPAHDRVDALARTLRDLTGLTVVVVDDGSTDPDAVRRTAEAFGARLLVAPVSRGPAAARNLGLAATSAELVAFVDSDCRISAADIRTVARHLQWGAVGAAAPRVRPEGNGRGLAGRFARVRSPLDLGGVAANVRPGGRVPFVPTTALVARRGAIDAVGGFDEALRFGEDVDLVWRMLDAGWQVRYDPSIVALHAEPTTWPAWLIRRFRYGASAGPLAVRHGDRVAGPPLAAFAAPAVMVRRTRGNLAACTAATVGAGATASMLAGLGRWARPLGWPVAATAPARIRRMLVVAALASYAGEWWREARTEIGPLPWLLAAAADDVAYGAGVWTGCVRARTVRALLPRITSSRQRSSP
jgi:mycofactocin system glycosyltransferase